MSGLFIYALVAAGLSQLLPRVRLNGFALFGLQFLGGYILFVVFLFFLHIVLNVPLIISAWVVVFLAVGGLVWGIWKHFIPFAWSFTFWIHPVPVLLLLGAAAVLFNGGIDYLPYLSDEFSNWLGASRHIFLAGDYGEVRDEIHTSGYTPGWRLALLFPWAVLGSMDEGASASAPFVAFVGLAGFLYDIVFWQLRRIGHYAIGRSSLFAWGALSVGMAAQLG